MSETVECSGVGVAEQVARYLSRIPRQMPSSYLYDALGSVLFDAICELPEYRIARTERCLLRLHGRELFDSLGAVARIVELGPGNGDKLGTLLEQHQARTSLLVHLIDVSSAALARATSALQSRYDVDVIAQHASYEAGLAALTQDGRAQTGATLMLFLGSSIGNFDVSRAESLLRIVRASLEPGDALLIGTDLRKPEAELIAAYDDRLQVTAAFNRNLLVRANRELDADFDLEGFAHRAVWNGTASRVEMHLVSLKSQRVRIPACSLDIEFEAGQTIWTESSYKYTPQQVVSLLRSAGFETRERWTSDGYMLSLAYVP